MAFEGVVRDSPSSPQSHDQPNLPQACVHTDIRRSSQSLFEEESLYCCLVTRPPTGAPNATYLSPKWRSRRFLVPGRLFPHCQASTLFQVIRHADLAIRDLLRTAV